MSDEDEPATKRYRLEDAPGGVPAPSTRWGSTPLQTQYYGGGGGGGATPSAYGGGTGAWRGMATPSTAPYGDGIPTPNFGGSATPQFGGGGVGGATPLMGGAGGRTPSMLVGATPVYGGLGGAGGATPMVGQTPGYQFEGTTPMQPNFVDDGSAGGGAAAATANAAIEAHAKKLEREWRQRNSRLTDEFLDDVLPSAEYFKVLPVPPEYNPAPPAEPNFYERAIEALRTFEAPAAAADAAEATTYDIPDSLGPGMPAMMPEDARVFSELLRFHRVDPIPTESLPSYLLMKNLFKVKNGDSEQRRAGIRFLLDKASVLGSGFIFRRIFAIWRSDVLDLTSKHFYVDLIKTLVTRMGREARGSATEIVHMLQTLLSSAEEILREDGAQALALLTRVLGFDDVMAVIRDDYGHEQAPVRRHTAKVFAIAATAAPEAMGPALHALRALARGPAHRCRQTVALSIGELAYRCGHSIVALLPDLVPVLVHLLRDDKGVRREAAAAVGRVAVAACPLGIEELAPVVDLITSACMAQSGTVTGPFLQAFGALVPLMSPEDAQQRTTAMMPALASQFATPEDEHRLVLLSVVSRCVSADGVTPGFVRDVVLEPFFSGFWSPSRAGVAADRRTAHRLVQTTVELARKVGSADVLERLYREMKDEREQYQYLVLTAVRRVVEEVGTEAASSTLAAGVLDGAATAVQQDVGGVNSAAAECLGAVCLSLGPRLKLFLKQIFQLIQQRRQSPLPPVRAQAARLVSRIAPAVMAADGGAFLEEVGRSLYERMQDDDPHVTCAVLAATGAVLAALGAARYKPSVRELLRRVSLVMQNHHAGVQLGAVRLVEHIASHHHADVDAVDLHDVATKRLFELLDAPSRETRRCCTRAFGVIANKIQPFTIILMLINNLRQDKRSIRVCTAVALSAVAGSCGAFCVIPYLLNEYRISEGEQVATIVQHAVLKAVRYIFEQVGGDGADYAMSVVPLLQRALSEASLQMRRMATEAARAVVAAVAGQPNAEPLATHLLNYVHPNIVELLSKNQTVIAEERLKLVTAVVSFYEAAQQVLGAGVMMQYLVQGLFHPASKVRDIYRRTYNMIYLVSPAALVPHYPAIEDDDNHRYERYEYQALF